MSQTRAQLRRRIGQALGDVTPLTATVNGSVNQFIDTIRLSGGIENPRNRDIIFTSGANIGVERRVDAGDTTAGYISFAPLSNATAVADTAEMYNFRGKGWRLYEYHDAINQAIVEAYPLYKQPYNGSVAAVFDVDTGNMTIPATITHIAGIEFEDTDGFWQRVPRARRRGGSGWWVDEYAGTINVRDSNYTYRMNGNSVRLIGFTKPTELTAETSVTYIDPEWLVARAAAILCMSALDRDQGNYARGNYYQGQANANLSAIRTRGTFVPVIYTAV